MANCIQLIPADPTAVPASDAADQAVRLLRRYMPRAEDITVYASPTIRFFHPGENWTGVDCPACGKSADGWWDEARTDAITTQVLTIKAPCCGAEMSLNEMDFDSPSGFARFVLEAANPRMDGLELNEIKELEALLGLPLRQIYVQL